MTLLFKCDSLPVMAQPNQN